MRFLKQVFDFYLNASIHVALAVYSLVYITVLEFNLIEQRTVLYFTFYASITGYNFVKYFGLAKFHHRSLASRLKIIQLFSAICFLAMLYYAFYLDRTTLICILVFALTTFLYAIPFLPKTIFLDNQQNLRSISGLKIYIIGLVWAGVTVILPLLNSKYDLWTTDVMIAFVQRFLFVIVLIIPFEIRDLKYDSLKLATLPQRIGVKKTKVLGLLLLGVFFVLEFLKTDIGVGKIAIRFTIVVLTILLLVFSKIDQKQYYSSFWVEGIPIIWLLLYLMFG